MRFRKAHREAFHRWLEGSMAGIRKARSVASGENEQRRIPTHLEARGAVPQKARTRHAGRVPADHL